MFLSGLALGKLTTDSGFIVLSKVVEQQKCFVMSWDFEDVEDATLIQPDDILTQIFHPAGCRSASQCKMSIHYGRDLIFSLKMKSTLKEPTKLSISLLVSQGCKVKPAQSSQSFYRQKRKVHFSSCLAEDSTDTMLLTGLPAGLAHSTLKRSTWVFIKAARGCLPSI